ncbi:hypothetical protein CI109_101548 [Kwoniella shandongensis]|uniref:Uncharacterized protein n=1 Tax=Kwoniella shandongensis TaxID=1734106 RepID=A0A5M6C5U9_9TREE|nr:uncharacterized protein CI109_001320 [Kwoniella shandongensis]KAA5530516.1 hypothetical protein CI109_001320 [Kwoniella shandongensis]
MTTTDKKQVIVIGSGIFGMSTALWMLQDGKYDVTILEKCGIIPAPDAASTDLNKIIRSADYADPALAGLALNAVEHWRLPEWEGTYHESGVFAISASDQAEGLSFVESAYKNCLDLGLAAEIIPDSKTLESHAKFAGLKTGGFGGRKGYYNPIGGWAEAGRAVEVGLKRVRQLGGEVRGGAEVVGLIKDGKKVQGVRLKSGEEVKGDLVVVAAGAWTPALFALPDVSAHLPPIVATGQSVATMQLTPEEAERYSNTPVVFNLDDGYYIFPPNHEGIVKMAIHGAGYVNPQEEVKGVSIPRTKLTPGAEDGAIPKVMLDHIKSGLAEVYPELTKKDFNMTRLCWYCDTVTGDWLIDYHPDYENLFVATGGSGHAFKFAPVIGREILKSIEGNPAPEYKERWAFCPPKELVEPAAEKGDVSTDAPETTAAGADVRAGQRKVLKVEDLVTSRDLRAKL